MTLPEALVAVAIFAMAVAGMTKVFTSSRQSFAVHEAAQALKSAGEESMSRLERELASAKRIFSRERGGPAYLNALSLSRNLLAGSRLPTAADETLLEAPPAGAVGNVLFFAASLRPKEAAGVRVPSYRFLAYFLWEDPVHSLAGAPLLTLREWRSAEYADRRALTALHPDTLPTVLAALRAQGVFWAWDPATVLPDDAFSSIDGALVSTPGHTVAEENARDLTRTLTGLVGAGFRLGVCPNLVGGERMITPPLSVPLFAAAATGRFPSGFEVVAGGSPPARRVFVRLVLAAEGGSKGLHGHEHTALANVRDVW